MLVYVLICLCLALAGVAGLQLTYMFYLDRLDRERKKRLHELERRCRKLSDRLAAAEARIEEQEILIDSYQTIHEADEHWADVLDER
jgi:hypothetical protein